MNTNTNSSSSTNFTLPSITSVKSDILSTGSASTSSTSTSSLFTPEGIWEKIKSIGIFPWIIIIFILAFLGINVFIYLAQGTQHATGFFGPVINYLSNIARSITGQTLAVSAEGGKAVVNTAANVVDTGLNGVQQIGENIKPNGAASTLPTNNVETKSREPDNATNNAINKVLNSAQARQQEQTNQDYEADLANSSIQGGGKGGWCYIGDDKGFRSCAKVESDNMCMSGDIFPSQEVCVNPNLRP